MRVVVQSQRVVRCVCLLLSVLPLVLFLCYLHINIDYFQANDPSAPLGGSVASAGDGSQSKKKQYWPGEDDDDVDKSSSKPGAKSAKDNKQKVPVCSSVRAPMLGRATGRALPTHEHLRNARCCCCFHSRLQMAKAKVSLGKSSAGENPIKKRTYQTTRIRP